MRTFADLARELNRSPVYLRGLQMRFALPVLESEVVRLLESDPT